jgi:transposase
MLLLNARDLTDLQWATLDALIPVPPRRRDGRGRPWRSRRSVLNGILWVLRTGAPWADLPERYPSYQLEVHLPCIRVIELTHLEVDNYKRSQTAMKENEVYTKPGVIDTKPALAAQEGEIVAQLQKKVGEANCRRRWRKLYLSPSGHVFGCRLCHELTYESRQKSGSIFYELIERPMKIHDNHPASC